MILNDLDNIAYNKFANGEITLTEYIKYKNSDKIMNYEEKYKEALERARDLMTNQNPPAFDKHLIEIVFPELKEPKESEDERIRKMLRAYIHDFGVPKEYFGDVETSDVLAWLKKQSEKQPIWTDRDKAMIITLLGDVNQMTHTSNTGKSIRRRWLNSLEDKFNNGE